MYQGSHARAKKHSRIRMNKLAILFIAVVMLIGAAAGTTIAFLVTNTEPVTNNFTYGTIGTRIDEDFTGGPTKSNVTVTNTGNTDAFIRATYIITWRDAAGNIVPAPAEGTYEYSLVVNPYNAWLPGNDGYFYYPTPVGAGQSTKDSLLNCTVTKQPENYFLDVEILAEAIQSTPEDAIRNAWHVTIANGVVMPVTGN